MLGLMQDQPLLISSLIEFAERHHGDAEIVSRRVEGDIHRSTWSKIASRARQVANALDRFALSSWMPFEANADGSLDLYVQNDSPGEDKETNWLPAPKGSFNLTMRLYGAQPPILDGSYRMPGVTRVQ